MSRLSRPLTPYESSKLFDPIADEEPPDLFEGYNPPPDDEPIIPPHELIDPNKLDDSYARTGEQDLDFTPLTFGKHQGRTPEQVSIKDPGWIVWAKKNITNRQICSDALYRECLKTSRK